MIAGGTDVSQIMVKRLQYYLNMLTSGSLVSIHVLLSLSTWSLVIDILYFAAALRLEDESMLSISDLYVVEEESRVSLECFGTGRLEWTSSLSFEIPLNVSEEIYQSYDQTRDALALTIKNFTSQNNATYTCTTDLTDSQNNPISVSVLITSSK